MIAGLTIAGVGAASLLGSFILELVKKEPVYALLMKVSAGIFGVGGLIVGLSTL